MLITEHLMAGIVVAQANRKTRTTMFILVGIISCLIADLAVIFLGRPGEVEYLSHRIYTHSLLLWPIYSIIPVAIIYPFFRRSFKNQAFFLYVISALSFLSHIVFDLLTPYGVQLFYPLSKSIYSFDLFHSFDPIFITISSSFIILYIYKIIRKQNFTRNIVLTFVFIILSYTTVTIILKLENHQKYYRLLKERTPEAKSLAILPRTFWRWKLIAADADNYYVVFKDNGKFNIKEYSKNIVTPKAIICSDEYNKFQDYARFPVITENGNKYDFINLIYSPKTYCLTFILDQHSNILSYKVTGFDFKDSY